MTMKSSLTFVLCLLSTSLAHAQAQDRSVVPDAPTEVVFHATYAGVSPPVTVVGILLGDKQVPLDTPIPVSGMWLRRVGIVVKNISSKTIVSGGVDLMYPETGQGNRNSPMMVADLSLGRVPSHWYLHKDGSSRPHSAQEDQRAELRLLPGKMAVFTYDGPDHSWADQDQIRVFQKAGKFTKIIVSPYQFFFDDESLWSEGQYYLPVPPPEVWKAVSPAEFSNSSATRQPERQSEAKTAATK